MEDLLLALLEPLLEVSGEFLLGAVLEAFLEVLPKVWYVMNDARESWESCGPVVSNVTLGFAGAAAGLISALVIPHRVLASATALPGISVLLAPVCAGAALGSLGNGLRALGRKPSNVASFRGGYVFAFCTALVRWLMVTYR